MGLRLHRSAFLCLFIASAVVAQDPIFHSSFEPHEQPLTDLEAMDIAMALWRNDDPTKHIKGSCSGCHGADFIDLAVIGTPREHVIRRALIDGATMLESVALAQAVEYLRREYDIPERDARSFRFLQPGGQVLLPDFDDPEPRVVAATRDVAFADSLAERLPTFFGPPIRDYETALQAEGEVLDLVMGTNDFGANPENLNLFQLPVGIEFPLWSADLFHGEEEGTMNDWLSDISFDPIDQAAKAQWQRLQDEYLANPSNETFWRMYYVADEVLRMQPLDDSVCQSDPGTSEVHCGSRDHLMKEKFQAALIGQHLMRVEVHNLTDFFASSSSMPFSYITDLDAFNLFELLEGEIDPGHPMFNRDAPQRLENVWEVGDFARKSIGRAGGGTQPGTLRNYLDFSGHPPFVSASVSPERDSWAEDHEMRLAWFYIGLMFDPSLLRISGSNSTKSGEYFEQATDRLGYVNHNTFLQTVRMAVIRNRPEALVRVANNGIVQDPLIRNQNIRHPNFNGPRLLNDDDVPESLKDQVRASHGRFLGNVTRYNLLYRIHEYDLTGEVNGNLNTFNHMDTFFDDFQPETAEEDKVLVDAMRQRFIAAEG